MHTGLWILLAVTLATPDAKRVEFDVAGQQREALVFSPTEEKTSEAPVVFVFHGHGGSMAAIARRFQMHQLLPHAVVVVPQGLNTPGKTDPQGKKPGWQKMVGDQQDRDLKFFDVLLKKVRQQFEIDDARIYATGHSNGGGFTYLVSQARPGTFAAIAPSAAGAGGFRRIPQPTALPVFHLAGRRDQVVPFDAQQRTIARLRELNGCSTTGKKWAENCIEYPGESGYPIVTFIHEGGHRFPARGPKLIAKFFREHSRPEASEEAPSPAAVRGQSSVNPSENNRTFDIVIYSATPAGIAAAIAASQEGASVALVEPTAHVGGLTASGLSHPDFRSFEGLTGFYLDFTERVEQWYCDRYGADSKEVATSLSGTHAEPHVNETVFETMIAEAVNIELFKGCLLQDLKTEELQRDGHSSRRITSIEIASDTTTTQLSASYFIDASYDGDLMALAGVDYTIGREGQDAYGESLAPPESDSQLQGYNFRLIATQDEDIKAPVQKPARYDREHFRDILPLLDSGRIHTVFGYPSRCVFKAHIPVLPRGKYDINDVSNAPVRLSMPGENREWPDGSPEQRRQIFQRHLTYNVGLLWFLQNDDEVPDRFREEAQQWGWCRDEFTDNGHLPWQLYVRESRRMIGDYVFTQRDVEADDEEYARARFQPDAIAMGDYGPNCHGTAHEGPRYGGRHTGEFYQRAAPYQIPYGVLLNRKCSNILVPVACSSSHVGYCALRLEPIWSSLGQAAGTAARLAHGSRRDLLDVTPSEIRSAMHAAGAGTIYVSDVPRDSDLFRAVQWIGAQGGLHGLHPVVNRYGERGEHRIGQYYEAFPGHAFEAELPLQPKLRSKWITMLPAELQTRANSVLSEDAELTRGEAVSRLYELVQSISPQ